MNENNQKHKDSKHRSLRPLIVELIGIVAAAFTIILIADITINNGNLIVNIFIIGDSTPPPLHMATDTPSPTFTPTGTRPTPTNTITPTLTGTPAPTKNGMFEVYRDKENMGLNESVDFQLRIYGNAVIEIAVYIDGNEIFTELINNDVFVPSQPDIKPELTPSPTPFMTGSIYFYDTMAAHLAAQDEDLIEVSTHTDEIQSYQDLYSWRWTISSKSDISVGNHELILTVYLPLEGKTISNNGRSRIVLQRKIDFPIVDTRNIFQIIWDSGGNLLAIVIAGLAGLGGIVSNWETIWGGLSKLRDWFKKRLHPKPDDKPLPPGT